MSAPALERPEEGHDFVAYNDAGLENLPAIRWTVDQLLPAGGFTVCSGLWGVGKSFLALDIALSVATGRPFLGKYAVGGGPVIYVATEGVHGIRPRLRLWKFFNEVEGESGVTWVPEPVPLMDPLGCAQFCESMLLQVVRPTLVVLDTWARCFSPGDENSAQDTGQAVSMVDAIRRSMDVTVLALHHPPKSGSGSRGSGALEAAADAAWELKDEDGQLALTCRKMKDAVSFDPIFLRLVSHRSAPGLTAIPDGQLDRLPDGKSLTESHALDSCLLRLADRVPPSTSLTKSQRKVVDAIRVADLGDGATVQAAMEIAEIGKATFYRALQHLQSGGYVDRDRGKWHLTPKGVACGR